jgi:hypothetical protein
MSALTLLCSLLYSQKLLPLLRGSLATEGEYPGSNIQLGPNSQSSNVDLSCNSDLDFPTPPAPGLFDSLK